MQQTSSYINPRAAVPFFRSRWGLLSLLAVGSGLYLYQRRGGKLSSLFGRVWEMGMSARNRIGQVAPAVGGSTSADNATGDVGTFGSDRSTPSLGTSPSGTRQSSPNSGI